VALLERFEPGELPGTPGVTAVTLTELSVGPLVTDDDRERAARQARLQEARWSSSRSRPTPPRPEPSAGWRRPSAARAASRPRVPSTL